MSKTKTVHELTNVLSRALRHKVGSIVNNSEPYANRYAKDAKTLLKKAKKISKTEHWNEYDKLKIKEELKRKLKLELENKEFLDIKKFEIMDEEIEKVLEELHLK